MTRRITLFSLIPLCLALTVLFAVFSSPIGARFLPEKVMEWHPENPFEESPDTILKRADHFYRQRAFPFNAIPDGAYARAQHYVREKMRASSSLNSKARAKNAISQVSGSFWIPLGPDLISLPPYNMPKFDRSGRTTAVAIDRTNSNVMYAGGSLGGVWKTTNGGNSWTPISDFQPSLATGSIAIDPLNHNIIYIGTGDINSSGFNYFGVGILKSTDGGVSFTQLGADAFQGVAIGALVIDPNNTQILYAGVAKGFAGGSGHVPSPVRAPSGIYKSVDGGATWTRLFGAPAGDVRTVKMDPVNSKIIFATFDFSDEAGSGSGIYRTTDGGATWSQILGSGFPTTGFGRISLAIAPSSPPILYAALESTAFGADLLNIFKSTDGGASWTATTRPVSGFGETKICTCDFTNVLAVSPTNPNIVFFGGASLYRSTDGGVSWLDMTYLSQRNSPTGGMQGDVLAVEFDPGNSNRVIVGSDGGVFASLDSGNSWSSLNGNLSLTQFYHIAVHPTDDNYVLGGAQDKGVLIHTRTNTWDYVSFGDGGDMQIDSAIPSILYHPDIFMSFERSDDGGRTWRKKEIGLVKSDRTLFIMPVAPDPSNSQSMYLGSYRLYRTIDRGESWSPISGDLTNGKQTDVISSIAIAKSSPSTIYVGTSEGNVQVTTNGGATFSALKSGLPPRFISHIAIEPANSQIAYASVSGFGSGHVFRTTNGGNHWSDISGNLPDIPVNAMVLDPSMPGKIFIGTDIGVFATVDGGATWTEVGAETLPNSPVFDLKINNTGSLFAATFGRGVFKLNATPLLSIANVSAASYKDLLAKESIISAFGSNLAQSTQSAATIPLPTSLAGTTITVRDSVGNIRVAPLFYVSPQQINYQMPPDIVPGVIFVTATSNTGSVSIQTTRIESTAPGLFTANANGQGVPAAVVLRVKSDGSQLFEQVAQFDGTKWIARPIDLGPPGEIVFLEIYGTGIRNRTSLSAVKANIGGVTSTLDSAKFEYAGPAPGFVGLDQINVQLPRSLSGRGEVDLTLSVDEVAANVVKINIR